MRQPHVDLLQLLVGRQNVGFGPAPARVLLNDMCVRSVALGRVSLFLWSQLGEEYYVTNGGLIGE